MDLSLDDDGYSIPRLSSGSKRRVRATAPTEPSFDMTLRMPPGSVVALLGSNRGSAAEPFLADRWNSDSLTGKV